MNRHGEPETDFERWALDAGLGYAYLCSGHPTVVSKAAHDRLLESTIDAKRHPASKHLLDHIHRETVLKYPNNDR